MNRLKKSLRCSFGVILLTACGAKSTTVETRHSEIGLGRECRLTEIGEWAACSLVCKCKLEGKDPWVTCHWGWGVRVTDGVPRVCE